MPPWPSTEEDLARPLIPYLRNLHWEVYQEVQISTYGHVADLVATQQHLVWILEVKRSLTFALIEQAERWTHYAHYVSVACPAVTHRTPGRQLARRTLRSLGLGLFSLTQWSLEETEAPRLHRGAHTQTIRKVLTEAHKTFAAAGNADGLRLTPFTATCRSIADAVARQPGLTIKELLTQVETHYQSTATARSCIAHWASIGKIRGVRVERDAKQFRLYPA
jgi:hypothetical protein